jgi:hypothetical protein
VGSVLRKEEGEAKKHNTASSNHCIAFCFIIINIAPSWGAQEHESEQNRSERKTNKQTDKQTNKHTDK